MNGLPFLIVFVVSIVVMLLMISKWKIHPFLSIMLVALFLAILAELPLRDIPKVIGDGFASTFTSIGIVIILGALIGAILEKTGAALTLADLVIRLVGERRPGLAMELMGWVVSIPVFCDSGFVILDPIRKALVRRTGASSVTLTVCLACGLYVAHVFIPPTPGPIAAAQTLGIGDNLLLVMGLGVAASILPLLAGYLYARYIGHKLQAPSNNCNPEMGNNSSPELGEVPFRAEESVPSPLSALAPLVVPILLMALGSIAAMLRWEGTAADLCAFFGNPMIALAAGTLCAIILLFSSGHRADFFSLTDNTLRTVGPILFVTAAGSVLGRVIAASGLMEFLTGLSFGSGSLHVLALLIPWLVAALFKSAQGSSTVAITTTAGLMVPLLPSLGLTTPAEIALAVLAIGSGAMTVSHANDSYFWVVTRFGGLSVSDGYKAHTMATLVMGVAGIIGILLLQLLL